MSTAPPLTVTVRVPGRDELARVIVSAYGEGNEECPCQQDFEVADAILAAGYVKAEPSVPVEPEYEWGTSPFLDGTCVMMHRSEDSAVWQRERRGVHVYRRPAPAAWELVQP